MTPVPSSTRRLRSGSGRTTEEPHRCFANVRKGWKADNRMGYQSGAGAVRRNCRPSIELSRKTGRRTIASARVSDRHARRPVVTS